MVTEIGATPVAGNNASSGSADGCKPLTSQDITFFYRYLRTDPKQTVGLPVLNAGKMGRRKDLSDFDKGRIVMARRLGRSITETAKIVGCSRSAVVTIYRLWNEEGQITNRRHGVGRPRLIDGHGQLRLLNLAQADRGATVAQIANTFNDGHEKKVSEHTVHRALLRMGLRCRKAGRVSVQEEGGPTGSARSPVENAEKSQKEGEPAPPKRQNVIKDEALEEDLSRFDHCVQEALDNFDFDLS